MIRRVAALLRWPTNNDALSNMQLHTFEWNLRSDPEIVGATFTFEILRRRNNHSHLRHIPVLTKVDDVIRVADIDGDEEGVKARCATHEAYDVIASGKWL